MNRDTDPLTDRLRAADPARALPCATDADAATTPTDGAAGLLAARARRRRTRAGTGIGGGALALAAAVAFGTTTAGPVAAKPTPAQIVARAADASELTPGTIVTFTSDVRVVARGSFTQRRTTWLRLDGEGRTTNVRVLVTDARGEHVAAGVEDVFARVGGRSVLQMYDPRSDRVTTVEGSTSPSLLSQAHRLLLRAQAGDAEVRLLGEERYEGRAAYRLWIGNVEEPPGEGERRELLLDARSYEPLAMRVRQQGTDVEGRAFSYAFDERIVSQSVLEDSAENRARLRMHGPTG